MAIKREDAEKLVSELMREEYNYGDGKVAELEDLVKNLKEKGLEKRIIKSVLSDATSDGRMSYNPNILVGIRTETRLTGLIPSPTHYEGLIPSHSGHQCIRPNPDTEIKFEYPVYSFCPNLGYILNFMEKYTRYNPRALKKVVLRHISRIYEKEN